MGRAKWWRLAAALGVLALLAAACNEDGGGEDEPQATDCEWVIGTMGALSGDAASLGRPIAQGVEYAVNQANEAGDLPCELIY
ncbi:MAG TPA: hypothetical protein VHG30_11955, partial [Microvirga sp.]|nr:hypothetical protein [Microvirga sp.]